MVKLCGTEWYVKEDKLLQDDGQCLFDDQVILINDNRHKHRKGLALTHELLHVVFDNAGISDDEELTSRLEHGVYEMIKAFPEEFK